MKPHAFKAAPLVLALLTPGVSGQAPPDSVPSEAIDALFAPWAAADSPGAALAVVLDGEIVYSKGYGCAQLEYGVPITPDTVFHVASVSKQFTAAAICLLAEDEVLSLDDPIQRFVASVPDFGAPITLRHLLTHTSGLRDQWEMLSIGGVRNDDVITTRHILDLVGRQRELNFPTGERYLYCNTGFTLLAEAASRASGMPFRDFCEKRIFAPLKMERTHFHDDHREIVPNRAYSYEASLGGFRKSVLSFANVGATSLFTTAEDLVRWMWALAAGEVGEGDLAFQMLEPGRLNDDSVLRYGLGVSIEDYRSLEAFGHGGADAGFRSDVLFLPGMGIGVAVVSNLAQFRPSQLTRQVADLYLGYEVRPPSRTTRSRNDVAPVDAAVRPVEIDAATRNAFAGRYNVGGTIIEVKVDAERLVAGNMGESSTVLAPLSESRFRIGSVTLEFRREGDDPADSLSVTTGTSTVTGSRIKPSERDLTPYVGRYFSEEVGTYYDLRDEDGLLIAHHPRNGSIFLSPRDGDTFAGTRLLGSVRFARSEAGDVTGFRLSGGRVLNLWFGRE